MILTVTLTIAAACAAVNLWLALRVVRGRVGAKVMQGHGAGDELLPTARAHANFTEYAPFVLVLLALLELAGASPTWLWIAGAVFVAGRIAHGLGMTRSAPNALRAGGILSTWVVLALLAGWAAASAYAGAGTPAVREVPLEVVPRG